MPFTFAHPAAIIPIKNKWKDRLCLTGLVLGSMAPDYEYFINLKPVALYGHNFLGFFLLNLPLCFLLAYAFHHIIKEPLILHLPKPIDKWFWEIAHSSWRLDTTWKVLVFVYSALIGMLTHVVWDSFTHVDGIMVKLLPVLSTEIPILEFSVPVYKILQHGSTLAGGLIIFACLYRSKGENNDYYPIPAAKKMAYFLTIFCISFVLIFGIIFLGQQGHVKLGALVVTIIDSAFLGLLVASLIYIKGLPG